MSLPTIQFDGKLTSVYTDNMTLWFSYETLVAFRIGAEKVVHKNKWSNTTGKHIDQIDPGDGANRVKAEQFLAKWKELTSDKPLPLLG